MGCKKQGENNRVIVIQKEKKPPSLFPLWIKMTLYFALCFMQPIFWTFFTGLQTDPFFQNKISGCRLTGQVSWRLSSKSCKIIPATFQEHVEFGSALYLILLSDIQTSLKFSKCNHLYIRLLWFSYVMGRQNIHLTLLFDMNNKTNIFYYSIYPITYPTFSDLGIACLEVLRDQQIKLIHEVCNSKWIS